MERLTDGTIYTFGNKLENVESEYIQRVQKKLVEYEDAEEQGLLLRLPCKAGTKVFKIIDECRFPGDCYTKRMCKSCEDREVYIEPKILVTGIDVLWERENFGKTIFLTKAEAEKALAEMGRHAIQ